MTDFQKHGVIKALAQLLLAALGFIVLLPSALNIFLAPLSLLASFLLPFLFVRFGLVQLSKNAVASVFVAGFLILVISSLPMALVGWIGGLMDSGEPLALLALSAVAAVAFVLARLGAGTATPIIKEHYAS